MKNSIYTTLKKFKNILGIKANSQKTIAEHNREALINQGREQFKKLIEIGLNVPVAHL